MKSMITFAEDRYIPSLKTLWKSAFGDTDASCDYYFSNLHRHENMLVYVEGGEAVAMLTMLPLKIFHGKKSYCARYIFAVATQEDYRSRGISSCLIEYAHDYMKKTDVKFSLLVPASKSLFDFYEKRGYERAFLVNKWCANAADIEKPQGRFLIEACSAQEYFRIRRAAFEGEVTFAAWEAEMLSKIVDYMRFCGGEFYKIQTENGVGAAYVFKDKAEAVIKELALCAIGEEEALGILHTVIEAEKYNLITSSKGSDDTDFAMICSLCGENFAAKNTYFNIALD